MVNNIRPARFILPLFLLFLSLSPSPESWAKVYLDIDAPSFQQFAIAVPDFQLLLGGSPGQDNVAVAASDNLANLLSITGYFNVLNKKAYLEDSKPLPANARESVNFGDWLVIGAEYLVKGSFQYRGGDLFLTCRLYDVVKAELLLEKKYTGKATDLTAMTRKFAAEVLQALTGEGGVFASRIAFVAKKGDRSELLSVNFDGSGLIKEKEGRHIIMSPRWSPNGNYLSYTSFENENPDYYVKNLVSASTMKIASYKGINLSGGWSPDSKKVLLTLSKDGNEEIYVLDFGNRLLQRLTNNFAIDISPAWSPDGTKIIFVSNRSGPPQLYIMDTDGNNVRRLTYEGNYNTSPSWSPKGDLIAYEGRAGDGTFQIFTIGVNGDNVKQLTFDRGESNSPTWSPDGRYLAFSKGGGGKKRIYIMSRIGTNLRMLYEGSGDSVLPAWSPRLKTE